MKLADLISQWLKSKNLDWEIDWNYPVPALTRRAHWSRGGSKSNNLTHLIGNDRVYIDGRYNLRTLLASDPKFFESLETTLLDCTKFIEDNLVNKNYNH